ncbi:replication initiator protein A, partial [Escherichia coli]
KKEKRPSELLRYELPDGYVEVSSGVAGMASIWDYDIVIMAVSHLTEAMNRYREGQGDKPGRAFRPYVADILRFCRRSDGGRQYEEVEAALDRLKTTTVKVVRTVKGKNGRTLREASHEGLISDYRTVSQADNGKLISVEIEVPKWIYEEIVGGKNPDVLTVHPDFFLIEPGIGRFLYRLARRAAGKGTAKWSFQLIYERSGSTGTLKKFTQNLRRIIEANDLPEYELREEKGQSGPQLIMRHREAPEALPADQAGT